MSEFLRTTRLILRNFQEEDFPAVFSWRNDPDCAKFQRWEDTSQDGVRAYLARHRSDAFLSEQEELHYAIAGSSGDILGELAYFHNPQDACVTLGITIAPAHQGRGLATELLTAVIPPIRQKYPSFDIVGLIHPENASSIRLFEKLGFQRECYAKALDSYVYTHFAGKLPIGT